MIRLVACLAALLALIAPARAQQVDIELVLAIDISRSVDWEEGLLQREGYISAFSNPLLLKAIQEGYYGRIAVTYFEWSTWGDVRVVAPWTVISDKDSAARFTGVLRRELIWTGQRTSISQAIDFGVSCRPAHATGWPQSYGLCRAVALPLRGGSNHKTY